MKKSSATENQINFNTTHLVQPRANRAPAILSRRDLRGNMLLLTTIMLSFMLIVFFSVATLSSQLLKASQSKIATDNISIQESSIIQALRIAYYKQYWIARLGGSPFNVGQADAALLSVPDLLGVPGTLAGNTVTFNLSGNLVVNLTLVTDGLSRAGWAGGFWNPATNGGGASFPSPGGYALGAASMIPIDNSSFIAYSARTSSWLGSLSARVYALPVKLEYTCTYGGGNQNEIDIIRYRSVLFCEIPQKQVALLAEQDINAAPTGNATVAGNVRVKGKLDGALTAATVAGNEGSIIYGNTTTGAANIGGGPSITGGGGAALAGDFRYQSEIKGYNDFGSSTLRSGQTQALLDPVRIIPANAMYLDGLATIQVGAAATSLYQNAQPFYSIPVNGISGNTFGIRLWGQAAYNAGTGVATFTAVTRAGGATETTLDDITYQASYNNSLVNPLYVTLPSGNYVVLEVDPSALISSGVADGKDLKIFIGGFTSLPGSPTTANYSPSASPGPGVIVSLAYVPELQTPLGAPGGAHRPNSITIITPNDLIFEAAFNYDSATPAYVPVPASYIAPTIAFGYPSTSNPVIFSGSVRAGTTATATSILAGDAYNNTAPIGGVPVNVNVQDLNATLSANVTYNAESALQQNNMSGGEMLYVTLPVQQ